MDEHKDGHSWKNKYTLVKRFYNRNNRLNTMGKMVHVFRNNETGEMVIGDMLPCQWDYDDDATFRPILYDYPQWVIDLMDPSKPSVTEKFWWIPCIIGGIANMISIIVLLER